MPETPEPLPPTPHPAGPRWLRSRRLRTGARLVTTAALAAACVILSALLWQARREIGRPPPAFDVVLPPADAEIRGGAGAEPIRPSTRESERRGPPADRQVFRPPRGHRIVLTLELPGDPRAQGGSEEVVWAAEVLPPTGEGPGYVQRATLVLRGAVQVELPPDPAPGQYRVNLHRFQGQTPERVARYGFRIGLPEDAPEEPAAPPG
jgi:hypothetical protein